MTSVTPSPPKWKRRARSSLALHTGGMNLSGVGYSDVEQGMTRLTHVVDECRKLYSQSPEQARGTSGVGGDGLGFVGTAAGTSPLTRKHQPRDDDQTNEQSRKDGPKELASSNKLPLSPSIRDDATTEDQSMPEIPDADLEGGTEESPEMARPPTPATLGDQPAAEEGNQAQLSKSAQQETSRECVEAGSQRCEGGGDGAADSSNVPGKKGVTWRGCLIHPFKREKDVTVRYAHRYMWKSAKDSILKRRIEKGIDNRGRSTEKSSRRLSRARRGRPQRKPLVSFEHDSEDKAPQKPVLDASKAPTTDSYTSQDGSSDELKPSANPIIVREDDNDSKPSAKESPHDDDDSAGAPSFQAAIRASREGETNVCRVEIGEDDSQDVVLAMIRNRSDDEEDWLPLTHHLVPSRSASSSRGKKKCRMNKVNTKRRQLSNRGHNEAGDSLEFPGGDRPSTKGSKQAVATNDLDSEPARTASFKRKRKLQHSPNGLASIFDSKSQRRFGGKESPGHAYKAVCITTNSEENSRRSKRSKTAVEPAKKRRNKSTARLVSDSSGSDQDEDSSISENEQFQKPNGQATNASESPNREKPKSRRTGYVESLGRVGSQELPKDKNNASVRRTLRVSRIHRKAPSKRRRINKA